ncbi:Ribonucleases G and E [Luteitalea pratensis]|uniref:Ribonucleases G and E n=1 Tax=Luteitalea pratensis TaxID=1855912 RepID=A0A143PTT5_LUTPR|nr:DUF6600 domain-containing protein [Luteitalea pratensis]AMY11229.1 Ribonucleases G and E [Luteitalea pratensis]
MNALVFVAPLALAVALVLPANATAQPAEAPPADTPPHLIRLEGSGAQAIRDGAATPVEQGDPVFFGDRLDLGDAYGQVLWGDGSRIALDRGARLDALAEDLLALTAGRTLVSRPAGATAPLRLDTPAASLILAPDGEYRVSLDGDVTSLAVTRGHADVQTGMGNQIVGAGYQVALRDGITPEAPRRFNAAGYDSFIAWATAPVAAPAAGAPLDTFEDPRFEAYSDVFNRYGGWETDPQYGAVWYPTVAANWRPYTAGYWHAYGSENQWLWVGRDPFGWPTHHYGRWGMNNGGRWYWMPGRQWAPAWVSWSVGPGYIGWSPLGNQDRPVRSWDTLSQPRGVYPGGTLDASRAWTVVPSDRFGQRGHMSAYAVDPRTLDNLSAFVSQRVGPPARYGHPAGGPGRSYGEQGGTAVYGPGGYYGGVRSRSGGDTNIRGGVGPTRVGPGSPGYGGPTPPPEDPYERAERAVAPRGRQRPAAQDTATPARPPAQTTDPAPPAQAAPRQRTPPRETPTPSPPKAARETAPPPPAAAPPPAPPAADSTPPATSAGRSTGTGTGRRAVPRP